MVNKRRIIVTYKEAISYFEKGIIPNNNQVFKEIEYITKNYNLKPSFYIAYDRYAYNASNTRITFDKNIRMRTNDLKLSLGDYGEQILNDNLMLMEIKVDGAMPLWLSKILNKNKIFPSSFSKYGKSFIKTIEGSENYVW